MLDELRYYSRMAAGVARLQRERLPADPEKFVRDGLLNRQQAFLDIVERAIFGDPENPYRRMFQLAGCEFGDLAASVRGDGLESTLLRLRREAVYLSHDEWKGATPIVRAGREISGGPESFKNRLVTGWQEHRSSGSTGPPIASTRSTASLAHACVYQMLRAREFRHCDAWIDVKPILPFPGGLNSVLRGRRTGAHVDRWFSVGSTWADYGHYRAMTRALLVVGNIFGARAPYPVYLPPNDFSPVAAHVARRRSEGRRCAIHGIASPLVRVAGAALERGFDISGSIFICGGEALTSAKRAVFENAGARAFASYTMSEIGNAGAACSQMDSNSVHLLEDSVAAISVPRPAPYGDGAEVNSLHFTTLTPYAPNIFVNVEMDDGGVLELSTCDCVYSRAGLTRSIRRIQSFGKATPQGMAFHRSELIQILEEALPARLGGGPGDYQLIECEAGSGQTQLRLYVSPRVGIADSARVREVFLEIMRARWSGALATRLWRHSGGIEVVIAEPVATHTGKVHPVRLLGTVITESAHAS